MVEKTEETAEIIVDFFNALEAACVNAKMQIAKLYTSIEDQTTKKSVGLTWNPEKIIWEQTEGERGPYERSEDLDSLDFKELLKDLAKQDGKLTQDGKFYWVFNNGLTVGRKKAQWIK